MDIGIFSFEIQRLQVHTFVLSAFASIVGPFGGFFASGLKRSIKIKVRNSANYRIGPIRYPGTAASPIGWTANS